MGSDAATLGLDETPRPVTIVAEIPDVLMAVQDSGLFDPDNPNLHFEISQVIAEIKRTTALLRSLPDDSAGFAQIPFASLGRTLTAAFEPGVFPTDPGTGEVYTAHRLAEILEGMLVQDRVRRRAMNGAGPVFVENSEASPLCRTIELLITQSRRESRSGGRAAYVACRLGGVLSSSRGQVPRQ